MGLESCGPEKNILTGRRDEDKYARGILKGVFICAGLTLAIAGFTANRVLKQVDAMVDKQQSMDVRLTWIVWKAV